MHTDAQHIGVIDLGSNTARLIVMQAMPGFAYRLTDEIREVVRLRQGLTEEGLSEAAMHRAMFALRLFHRFCRITGVDIIIATATSAVREAANGAEFVEKVQSEIGLTLRILDGEREAYYGVVGALNEVPVDNAFVVDIGGGSAQISKVSNRMFESGIALPLGSLALTEKFVRSDPIDIGTHTAIQSEIKSHLRSITWLNRHEHVLIGLGGTIRNLAWIDAKRMNYPLNTLHGYQLSRASIKESIRLFRQLPLARRENIPGLNSDRADIILPGAMVINEIMKHLRVETLTVSVNGLREGVFLEQFWAHLESPILSSIRRFSPLNMARVYNYQKDHANHVRLLSTRLFDQLLPLHGFGLTERELLESAALLHDLGTLINYADHHKHSATMITNAGLAGFTPRESALIALLARFHRKGSPSAGPYQSLLLPDDQRLLVQLAAILRLAEYLERGRTATIEDISASWDDADLTITLISDVYPAVEIWESQKMAVPLFERAFSRRVHLSTMASPVS